MKLYGKFAIFAAVFFLLCSFAVPNFVRAESANDLVAKNAQRYIENVVQTSPHKKKYRSKQRPLLIEGAMNIEIEKLVRALKNPVTYQFSKYLYIAGTYKDYPVVILRTEQGVSNTGASTVIAIKEFNPIAVINQGTAGSHTPDLHLNDIVIGAKSINIAAYMTPFSAAGAGIDMTTQKMRGTFAYDETTKNFRLHTEYDSDTNLVRIAESVANSHREFTAVTGTISTADSWIEIVDYIVFLNEKYGSLCEEMENNAAAQICKNNGVPFIGIRVISDNSITAEEFSRATAHTCQDFVLLVAEKFIDGVKNSPKK